MFNVLSSGNMALPYRRRKGTTVILGLQHAPSCQRCSWQKKRMLPTWKFFQMTTLQQMLQFDWSLFCRLFCINVNLVALYGLRERWFCLLAYETSCKLHPCKCRNLKIEMLLGGPIIELLNYVSVRRKIVLWGSGIVLLCAVQSCWISETVPTLCWVNISIFT